MLGWAAPTEAAALGAFGAFFLSIVYGKFSLRTFYEALMKTLVVTSMIMFILMAGSLFTGVFVGNRGMTLMRHIIEALDLGPWGLVGIFLGLVFIAGFFLEWVSILLIFLPLFMPFINAAGMDPVWFCMLVLIMIQTSYLTPPMAPAIFYLRGVAPPEITLRNMYAGVVPFILIQVVTLAIVAAFPQLALWLPDATCWASSEEETMTPDDIRATPCRTIPEAQRERFLEEGAICVERAIGDEWLAALRAGVDRLVERSRSVTKSDAIFDLEPGHTADAPRLRRVSSPADQDDVFWRVVTEGPVGDIAADLLGPDVKFYQSKLNFKWARGGAEVKWHQDQPFFPHTNHAVATFGIYLNDCGPEQGPLQILPGSQRGPIYDHYDAEGVWRGELRAGGCGRAGHLGHARADGAGRLDDDPQLHHRAWLARRTRATLAGRCCSTCCRPPTPRPTRPSR